MNTIVHFTQNRHVKKETIFPYDSDKSHIIIDNKS
jgi:hypothetical protein